MSVRVHMRACSTSVGLTPEEESVADAHELSNYKEDV